MFISPIPFVCPGKTTKHEVTKHNPIDWIADPTPGATLTAFRLDGYVVNETSDAITAIFKKLVLKDSTPLPVPTPALGAQVLSRADVVGSAAFATMMGLPFHIVIFHESLGMTPVTESTPTLIVISALPNQPATCNLRTVADLRRKIRGYRGTSFQVSKELRSADTHLECYLANNPGSDGQFDSWPGDFDAVVFDIGTNAVRSLIEFKTHNGATPTAGEYLGKWPKEDHNRVKVLFALRDAVSRHQQIPLSLRYVVWGTKDIPAHDQIKITEIVDRDDLEGNTSTSFVPRPAFGTFDAALLKVLS